MKGGDEERLKRGEVGQPLVLLQAADLPFTIANRNGELQLGEPLPPAQVFEQVAKSLE
jgi:hypothetical protein